VCVCVCVCLIIFQTKLGNTALAVNFHRDERTEFFGHDVNPHMLIAVARTLYTAFVSIPRHLHIAYPNKHTDTRVYGILTGLLGIFSKTACFEPICLLDRPLRQLFGSRIHSFPNKAIRNEKLKTAFRMRTYVVSIYMYMRSSFANNKYSN